MLFGCSPEAEAGLKGIAALRAQSAMLEAKRSVRYYEMPSRSLLNRIKPGNEFSWSINPYRGCEFACRYCSARYTHEFMELRDSADFEDRIYAKANAVENLRRELKKFRGGPIVIGTATDPYQPAERRFGRTRAVLEVFAEHSDLSVTITTKSDLVTRDLELLREAGRRNEVFVNMTITTVDADLARLLEPRAPRPELRLQAVRRLADAGVAVGVYLSPLVPLITDQEEDIDRVASAAKENGASWLGGGALFLKAAAQRTFFPFLAEHFPGLLRRYEERYRAEAYLSGPYLESLRRRILKIRTRYGMAIRPPHEEADTPNSAQGVLFPILPS